VYIFDSPLSVQNATDEIRDEYAGGEAIFVGRVRRISEGRRIKHLFYECQIPMAERQIQKIIDAMRERWPLKKINVQHRIGRLEVGDIAVIVAVSSEHRKEALEACRFGIDEIKHRVPIWKKEISEQGEEWIGVCDHERVDR
jgi:molybdopterin synthase catalytic subunit